jgi:hypothetical protein
MARSRLGALQAPMATDLCTFGLLMKRGSMYSAVIDTSVLIVVESLRFPITHPRPTCNRRRARS